MKKSSTSMVVAVLTLMTAFHANAAGNVELAYAAGNYAAGNADLGRKEFNEDCAVCHSVKEGKNKIGPSLFGVVGRKAGSIADYNYSDAMRANNNTWTPETIASYVRDPQKVVPGAKMPFKMPDKETDQEIADLIAYLATLH